MTPRREAAEAARWWASRLGGGSQDNGTRDPESAMFQAFAFDVLAREFTAEQRAAFEHELAEGLEQHLRHCETGTWAGAWSPGEPKRGSAVRCVMVDYGPAAVLDDAAERAGIRLRTGDLPIKTQCWINPGEVVVSDGYGAPREVIWSGEPSPPHEGG